MNDITYLEAIRQAMWEEMARDENVILLGEDVGAYGGAFGATKGLFEEFGASRIIDTPISESLIVGAAVGAALQGKRPVAEMQFMDFISCGFDQLVNVAATTRYRYGGKVSVPIVVRGPSGGGVHGGLFHSQNPERWFFSTPGLKVVAPATPRDAKGLLKSAIRDPDPVLFFEHKNLYRRIKEDIPESEDVIVPLGKADVKREGSDITIITYGWMLHLSLEAAEAVAKDKIDVEVIDLRSLVPLDTEAIFESVKKTSKVVIVHEHSKSGGVGAEVAALVAEELFEDLDGPIMRVAGLDTPVPFAPPMEELYLPNAERISDAVRKLAAY